MSKAKMAGKAEGQNSGAQEGSTAKEKIAGKAEDQTSETSGTAPAGTTPPGATETATTTKRDDEAQQDDDTAGPQPAPRPAVPDAAAAEAISAFVTDWREDVPAEAAGGNYSPHARDRFAERDYSAIPDGTVFSKGWVFVFGAGRFLAAADMSTAHRDIFVPEGQIIQIIAA